MHSIEYYLAKTPGLRKLLKWSTARKINRYKELENQRKTEDPKNLMNFESKVFSQNGEDGVIEEIFRRIGTTDRFFVEFGVENGRECNGRYLLEQKDWSGLWIDGSPENVASAQKQFGHYPIKVIDRFIKKENIKDIFSQANVPKEFDLLSIDIDGNDYWIWDELKSYSPRVVVMEYNSSYLAEEDWIMPYNPNHLFDGTSYYGASLKAFESLAEKLGYVLVGCESQGVNAFFVRQDLVQDHFTHTGRGASYHYVCPKYRGLFFGHPKGKGPWRG